MAMKHKFLGLAAISLAVSPLYGAVDDTSGSYRATSGQSSAAVLQQSEDGSNAGPVNSKHPLPVGGLTYIVGSSFTTPAGTTPYTALDLIGNSATAGSVVPLTFAVCRQVGTTGMIRRARIKTPDSGFAGQSVILWLYRDSPTVTNGDNGAFLSTESNFIGSMTIVLDKHFSDPIEKGVGVPDKGSEINFDCATASQNLYGLLQAGTAITPQGAKLATVVLEALVN